MPDDETLLTLENGDGSPVTLPAALTTPDPVAPVAEPEPAAPVVEPPAAPVAPVADPPAPVSDEGSRVVPLSVLMEERKARKAAEQEAQAGRDLATALRMNPDAVMARMRGPAPAAPEAPDAAELEAIARELTLVTIDGKPDLKAAESHWARMNALVERKARKIAESMVGPLKQERLSERADAQLRQAFDACTQAQVPAEIAGPILNGLRQTNPELLADPASAATAVLVAIGLNALQGKAAPAKAAPVAPAAPAPAPVAPVFTEGSGGRSTTPTMSAVERDAMRRIGIKPSSWEKATAALNTGAVRPKFMVMEED